MPLRCHNGILLSPYHAAPRPWGKLGCWRLEPLLALVPERCAHQVSTVTYWFIWRFHDSSADLLVTAALLLREFVTREHPCASDREAPYFVTLFHALWERPTRVTRSPRAVLSGQAGAVRGRDQVCRLTLPAPAPETAAPTCRQNDG